MAYLSNFEENAEFMKEGMIEDNENKKDKLPLIVQMSVNSGVMNKRTLSEADGTNVDEEISNKKIKMHPQNELTIS